jgi:hypothetical protein
MQERHYKPVTADPLITLNMAIVLVMTAAADVVLVSLLKVFYV